MENMVSFGLMILVDDFNCFLGPIPNAQDTRKSHCWVRMLMHMGGTYQVLHQMVLVDVHGHSQIFCTTLVTLLE